jgi:hypothetical protein
LYTSKKPISILDVSCTSMDEHPYEEMAYKISAKWAMFYFTKKEA